MSLSTPSIPGFLLDENVRSELAAFLKSRGVFFSTAAKGASDAALASVSKRRKLALVTNDKDFAESAKDEVFSVILLKLPQDDPDLLCSSFSALLEECGTFAGRLIIVEPGGWTSFKLPGDPTG